MKRAWLIAATVPWLALALAPTSAPLTVVIGGDLGGYLSPCGCSKPMQGGLRRLAGFVQSNRQAGKTLFLLNGPLSGGIGRQDELKAETVAESLKRMACSGFNLTAGDARLGVGLVSSLQRLSGGKMLSSSLAEGNGVGALAGREVGPFWVTGVSANASQIGTSLGEASSDWGRTIALAKQRPIIVLFDGDLAGARRIARESGGVKLVIYSSGSRAPASPARENQAWLVTPGEKGKSALKLTWKSTGWASYSAFSLGPEIADDPQVSELYTTYLERVDREDLLEAMPRRDGPAFAGTKVCSTCHAEAYKKWKATDHAGALATLEHEHHDRDPDCVSCHVVGLDKTQGFRTRAATPHLANVGCESCHGAGAAHSEAPMRANMPKIGEDSCMKCHVPAHSPAFNYSTYWLKVAHGGEN